MQSSQQHEIQLFVASCKTRLHKLLKSLDWSEEGVHKNFNTNSLAASTQAVPKKSKQSATAITPTYPESCITNNSIVLKTPELQNLLGDFEGKLEAPQNFNDLQANFTRDQKLLIYEHTIQNTKKLNNNTVAEVPDGEVSLAEIVAAARREAKRKKRKFRKTKPTRIEEVRALIQLQMQAMQKFIANHQDGTETNIEQGIGSDIQVKREDRLHDYTVASSWKNDDNRKTYSRYQENREKSYGKRGNASSDCPWDSQAKYRDSIRDYDERREQTHNRRPEPSRHHSHKEYPKQRESATEYKKYARKRSRSPESHKYHEKDYHKRHESCDKSTRERDKRRGRSPVSNKYSSKSKRDEDYYRRRSKSPISSHIISSRNHKDRTHKNHHRQRSRSRERHRHKKKSRSRSKSRQRCRKDEYSQGDIKRELKSENDSE